MAIKTTLASALIASSFLAAPVMAQTTGESRSQMPEAQHNAAQGEHRNGTAMQQPASRAGTADPATAAGTHNGQAAAPVAPAAAAAAGAAHTQVATHPLGVSADISTSAAQGWSVKNALMGKNVHNDSAESENVGDISDVVLDRDGKLAYAVVNASRFLGMSSHHVLIPIDQFRFEGERIVLPGSTKEALRELPEFDYND